MDRSDITLFYFSGHGVRDNYEWGYFAPHDMDNQRPLACGVAMHDVKRLALQARNKGAVILILDCCHSAIAAEVGKRASIEVVKPMPEIFGDTPEGKGVFIISSSAADEESREMLDCKHKLTNDDPHPHGAFTFHLLEGLQGAATRQKPDWISLAELYEYVEGQIQDETQKPEYFGARVSNAKKILIARAAEMERVETELERIRQYLNSELLSDNLWASRQLYTARLKSPHYKDVCDLAVTADECLKKSQKRAWPWMRRNAAKFRSPAREGMEYLEIMLARLSVDEIGKQDDEGYEVLAAFFRAIGGEVEDDVLLGYLAGYNPTGTKQPSTKI
jgi:hypothetical protein